MVEELGQQIESFVQAKAEVIQSVEDEKLQSNRDGMQETDSGSEFRSVAEH